MNIYKLPITGKDSVVVHSSKTTRGTQVDIVYTPLHGLTCYMNGSLQSSECDEKIYHSGLVRPLMGRILPQTVCIFGGGEGATAREVLSYTCVTNVKMIDWDADVVELFKKKYPQWAKGAWQDPRLCIEYSDAFIVCTERKSFDAVIIDLFDPDDIVPSRWYDFISKVASWAKYGIVIYCGTQQHNTKNISKTVDTTMKILESSSFNTKVYYRHMPSYREPVCQKTDSCHLSEDKDAISPLLSLLGRDRVRKPSAFVEEDAVFLIGIRGPLQGSATGPHCCEKFWQWFDADGI